ncbi:MAG: hypothetical protein J0I40_10810 [Cellulomonas sp.]|uniref:hypothetical protein n=1 Tax=Cellulomonas sp. 73-92 TaxID=1895740 RepID=UPI000AEB03DE|nr:hypothetical protein [Cellulomonas sp. 73-92]MBN9375861.1 hypothetical protein [Cellulomonas sp.]
MNEKLRKIRKTIIERLFIEMLVDADAHTKDSRWGMPLIREKAAVVTIDGTPQLVWA